MLKDNYMSTVLRVLELMFLPLSVVMVVMMLMVKIS